MLNPTRWFTPLVLTAATTLLVLPAHAVLEGWTVDYDAAQAQAQSSGKDLLLNFTGSDWCPPCIFLHDEIFDTDVFRSAIPQGFVPVELDFPHEVPQPAEVVAQNKNLIEKYDLLLEGGAMPFPIILLTDSQGKPYARTGAMNISPEAYVKHLNELQANRVARDEAFHRAASLEGLDKAKALDAAMQAIGMEIAFAYYEDTVQEILELDADNSAGLQASYQEALAGLALDADVQEVMNLVRQGYLHDAVLRFDQIIDEHQPTGANAQIIIATQGQTYLKIGEKEKAKEALQKAIDAAPDSQVVPQIIKIMDGIE